MMQQENMQKELLSYFKWFHKHPELSYQEVETTIKIIDFLNENKIEMLKSDLKTGVVALIRGKKAGPVIALRTDMDALPIKEQSKVAYPSMVDGVMHACGHDFHMAVVMGAAKLLKEKEDEIEGTIKIIFQPAEEAPGGAKVVLETGLLDDVRAYLGLHTTPELESGIMGLKSGAVMAAVDHFMITVRGQGTHAAYPQKGIDPIVVSSAIIQTAQSIISRNLDPFSPGLLSFTHIEGGNTWNVIPDTVFMEGTIRSMSVSERQFIKKRFEEVIVETAKAYAAIAEVKWREGPPPVTNDKDLYELAVKRANTDGFEVKKAAPSLGGEDFSYYLENTPGLFVRVGTGGGYAIHDPRFIADTQKLADISNYFANLTLDFLDYIRENSTI